MAAEAYLIHSDAVIVGMGGFSGQDPAPTVATLAQWVQQGQLRFVLPGGHGGVGHGAAGRGDGVSAQRVQQHCAVVNPSSYGAPAAPAHNTREPSDRFESLYDCSTG